jgi:hypothetical protein
MIGEGMYEDYDADYGERTEFEIWYSQRGGRPYSDLSRSERDDIDWHYVNYQRDKKKTASNERKEKR